MRRREEPVVDWCATALESTAYLSKLVRRGRGRCRRRRPAPSSSPKERGSARNGASGADAAALSLTAKVKGVLLVTLRPHGFRAAPLARAHFERGRLGASLPLDLSSTSHRHGFADQRISTRTRQDGSNACCIEEEGLCEGSQLCVSSPAGSIS